MFSERVPRSLEPNRITHAVRRARADGRTLIDLTATNPTGVGFAYSRSLVTPLANDLALTYSPQPFGLPDARLAVARDYHRRGLDISSDRIVLTASTSEAYSLLFKLLCEPDGDAVMVPVPSYPLFEHLTALDGVRAIPYRLDYEGRWVLAIDDLDRQWNDAVRALLAVSPNNPTGSLLTADEARGLQQRCASRDAALIVDEVFADYVLDDGAASEARRASDVLGAGDALTFRLGGLSKSAGLPQVKLGWIAVQGPDAIVTEALDRLEVICDAYLSVSTPVQIAAPALIDAGAHVREQILARIRANYRTLASEASAHPAVEVLHTDGGWSSVVRVPSTRTEEDLVVDLIDRDGVLVHPGFFFDFPHEAFVVISLLAETQAFLEGLRRVLERVDD
jgi:aspartate/methionine/tyrosine aminotransferase